LPRIRTSRLDQGVFPVGKCFNLNKAVYVHTCIGQFFVLLILTKEDFFIESPRGHC
jgi:hypothetical protein